MIDPRSGITANMERVIESFDPVQFYSLSHLSIPLIPVLIMLQRSLNVSE